MIKIIDAKKKYGSNLVINIKKFEFVSGKSYIIIGSNGSGKSTLIKCILGINKLSNGMIKINSKNIGYVPEKYYFPEFCSISKFLCSISDLYNIEDNLGLCDHYCDFFELNKDKKISKLSKGMQQKVLIIQALIHNADIYIFDEPLNGLDPVSQLKFFNILQDLKLKNKTIIITTHYPKLYGNNYDYFVKLENGDLSYENN